ncbi:MAG: hypothetical protein U0800_09305 [Isosphaeraceae bacterium]
MLAPHLATFRVDATPPTGHPLCGGWIKPVEAVDDPLWLRGVVLMGDGLPIVLASLDWTGVLNDCHKRWTEALAEAAHTTRDRVALHCVHQHNAPFVDRSGNDRLIRAGASTLLYDPKFLDGLIARSASAVRDALAGAQPFGHVRAGKAKVAQVACNRRVIGEDGKIRFTRTSATKDPAARAAPEGTIDPWLRAVTFEREGRPIARLYYYTTHPMSYYGDGRVTADFVGLARAALDREEPGVEHLYFTGSAGNVTAGKYNDGSHENRQVLADRVREGMQAAVRDGDAAGPIAFEGARWSTEPIRFAPREDLDPGQLAAIVDDPSKSVVDRNRTAMALGWLDRLADRDRPILLGRLDLGPITLLHLPAETFVEYQLTAQEQAAGRFLATAAYGDGGPWYIPLRRSFDEGGYEPSVALVSRETEPLYRAAIGRCLERA